MFETLGRKGKIVGVGCVLTFLVGCTPNTHNDNMISKPYSVSKVTISSNDLRWDSSPAVTDITSESFILLDGGSGSCPNVIENVKVNENNLAGTIKYKKQPENVACTADYVWDPKEIRFVSVIENLDNYQYVLDNGSKQYKLDIV